MMKRIVLTFILSLLALGAYAQNRMSSAEISYLYNQQNEFLVQHKIATSGNKVKVYLRFILNSGSVRISDYRLSYDIRTSYIDEKNINSAVRIDSSNVVDVDFRQYVYLFEFEKDQNEKLLVIDVYNATKNKHYNLDIPLSLEEWKPTPFLIFEVNKNIPYFTNYINKDYPVRIMNPFNGDANYEINGVVNNKAVSTPPFDDIKRDKPSDVPLDTLYGVNNGEEFRFHNEGYFTIKSPTEENSSLGIVVTDEFHPYFENYLNLMSPLIYISTNDEFKAMQSDEEPRNGFEAFVNNVISSNEVVAKDFIKYYYRRVRKSARLFSENKEGWKTDRGMIYQIYGNPTQVFRNESTELWVYPSSSGGRVRFIFDIVLEDGVVKHKLIRGKKFRESWMLAVTQWRSGRIIE